MKIAKLLAAAVLLATTVVHAQKGTEPTPEDIATAKSLRDKYPKDDIAIISATESVAFAYNRQTKNVVVNQSVKEKLMNIGHRADIHKFEMYSSEMEIEDFNMTFRNNKKAEFAVQDEFYTSNDLFYNDYRVKYMAVDFPVQGYWYNYALSKKYNDVKYFTTMYFHDDYPVVNKKLVITIPSWLDLEIKEFNFAGYEIKKEKTADAKGITYTYTLQNADARAKEDDMPGPSHLYPHLLLVARSYTQDGNKVTLFNATADLYKWYKSLVDTMDEKPEMLQDKVKELTANAKTDDEKIKNIYYWVQDNIRYIAFEDGLAGFRPDASQNVFTKRYGDCKGMANLTRQMLKLAGFDARLTWIGTRHIAYDYSTPSLSVDNHMICTLVKDGKKYFLDGTEKYNSFGEYAERIQGKEVMIEDGDKFVIEKVPVSSPSVNKEVYHSTFRIENDNLAGHIKSSLNGESRAGFLYGYNNIKNDKKENALNYYLSRGDKNFTVSNITTSSLTDRDKVLNLEYDAKLKNRVSSFDNEMYIDLDYAEEFAGLEFKERKTDFEFEYKKDYESVITLEIPQGYTVSRIPEPFTASGVGYTMKVAYEQKGGTIVYSKKFTINNSTIKKDSFKAWNESVAGLKKLYNDQITLTKQ